MTIAKRFLALSVSLVAAALAGCAGNTELDATSVSMRHPITVDAQASTLAVAVPMESVSLTDDDVARITAFATGYKARGHGTLDVAYPSGSPNGQAAMRAVSEIETLLDSAGIDAGAMRVTAYRASGAAAAAPVLLSFTQYVATPSPCGAWTEDFGYAPSRTPPPNYGCATRNNLARMVADPRDLVTPRDMDPADAQRRDEIFSAYRKGDVTAAERSEAESSALADVAK